MNRTTRGDLRKPSLRAAALATALLALSGLGAASGDNKPTKNPRNNNPNNHRPRDLSKGNTMFVVPYAHLDTQWRWAYPQVIREFIANTLHRNFDLIEKYPNYVFNFSGSRRYEMMKEYYPAEYQKLTGFIKAGRWFPCGSSVDENDANVPSAESLVRQVLYGNHYFRREFGVASDEYMLPDCFGFPYALPSVLVHCGIKGFSTQKLTWNSAHGIPFKVGTWEGPDGKSVVAALDPGGYGSSVDEDLSQNTSWLARIQNTGKLSGAYVDYKYYGTGDTGGGPRDGSVEWVEKSITGGGPISVVSSHADEMFKSLTPQQVSALPHYKGELLLVEHSAGSISSEAMMKRWNRKGELLADGAERASVTAAWLGTAAYPSKRLYNAWDLLLGSQMHDMLPGTSIPKAYEFCWNDELLAQNQFAAVETDALGAITSAMDTRGRGQSVVIYNPLSIERTDVVEAKIPGYTEPLKPMQVYGPDGKRVPTQTDWADGEGTHILFPARVPANGFAVYHVEFTGPQVKTNLKAFGNQLENERFRVTINKAGDIASIYDKLNKREVLKAPARLDFQFENPRQFPAWNMDWDDAKLPPRGFVDGPAKIHVVEEGPVRATIEVERSSGGSTFVQDIRLTAGGDRVEIENKIDWQTKETALKASFPLASGSPTATYDLQVGAIERGNDNPKQYEVPNHQWIDLTKPDKSYGVGILNDSKFGSDKPNDDTIRETLIYTPGIRGGYADQATQDFGKHDILISLAPHTGDWRKAGVPWQAKRLNQPLRAFNVPKHAGSLGSTISLISTNSNQVEISAMKKAEDSDDVVIRLRELTGMPAHGVVVKAASGILAAREVDGQERTIGAALLKGQTLVTDVSGFSLRAFALKLGHRRTKAPTIQSQAVALAFDADVASTDGNRSDGAFDKSGRSIAAEQLPGSLTVDGINFTLGSTKDGAKNAVTAHGQKIPLPSGFNRVYVLAASANGDKDVRFHAGSSEYLTTVENWGGYVGQWDNRLWASDPGPNFNNYGAMAGLAPAYVKKGEVAWFASHRHTPAGNTFYEYTYLFKYGFDVPSGVKALTLPNDPDVKIMAVSVARNTHDSVKAAHALSDTLEDHVASGQPSISPSSGSLDDATAVTIAPPLYWEGGGLHYTTDGTKPTASSPVYRGPFMVNDPTTIKAVEIDSRGNAGPSTSALVNVHDTTAPKVVSVTAIKQIGVVRIKFSEPVDKASAQDGANYGLDGVNVMPTVHLGADLASVQLDYGIPVSADRITVHGVKDLAKAGNTMIALDFDVVAHGAIISQATFEPKTTKVLQAEGLPIKAHDSWTVNFFCKIDSQPADRTMIAGFGRSTDGRTGTGRYICKFPDGISFWASNNDVFTRVPLDTGKWQMLTATYDGTVLRLYKNGEKIGEDAVDLSDDTPQARVMPLDAWERQRRFGGEVRNFTIWDVDLPAGAIKGMYTEGIQRG